VDPTREDGEDARPIVRVPTGGLNFWDDQAKSSREKNSGSREDGLNTRNVATSELN
jgi:hypothetical protein